MSTAGARVRSVSIRLRLTLLYTGILALTLVAFGSIVYWSQSQSTYDGIRSNLIVQSQNFLRGPESPRGSRPEPDGAQPHVEPVKRDLPEGTLPGRWTQTRTVTGTVVGQTLDLTDATLPLSPAGLQAVQGGTNWFETGDAEGQPVLIYSTPYTARDGAAGILQVAFPIAQPQQTLNTLRLLLVAGSGLAILAALGLGWVLAGTALRPIHRITQTAQVIGAERDFGRRVEHAGPVDEVGQLAITFNSMLGQLESAYRQLEESLGSQRRFVADASHELRTPLTTVRGNIELLGRDMSIEPAERAEILADTREEVDRLIRLVTQLLVLARADAGQKLRAEPVPLGPLVEDACRQMKTIAPESSVTCRTPGGATALADPDAVKQVLLILLDNAHRHAAPGARIEIVTELLDGQVAIHVHNTGPGIAPEAIPHIFERFTAARPRAAARGQASGWPSPKSWSRRKAGRSR